MYSSLPRRDRITIRITLTIAWSFSALAGVGGILLAPVTVQNELAPHVPFFGNAVVVIASIIAAVGILLNRHQYEWVGSYFAAGGLFIYLITVWYLFATGTPTRLQQASYLTSLLFFFVYRIVANSAHARKQRLIHKAAEEMSGGIKLPDA